MKMHFSKEHVARLIEHTKAAPEHRALYGIGKAEVGLWLVGDTGYIS